MTRRLRISLSVFLLVVPLLAQEERRPKSQEEAAALQALFAMTDPDARIAGADELIKKFKNTDFKDMVLYAATRSYRAKNDFVNMMIYGERTLDVNADHVPTLVELAYVIPMRTREFDLDKDEKLAKSDDYAKRALRLIPTMAKLNPATLDEEWLLIKKDLMSQVHESLGSVAMLRKDFAGAEESFRTAIEVADEPTGVKFFRLAQSLMRQGRYDEALEAADRSVEAGGLRRSDGQDLALLLKEDIEKAKQAGTKPAPASSDPLQPKVEVATQP